MYNENAVFVKCQFAKGGFPTERVFVIQAPGGVYTGMAPEEYCYTQDKRRLNREPAKGEKIEGYLMGITLGEVDAAGRIRIYLPDSNIYEIEDHLIEARENPAHVPIES